MSKQVQCVLVALGACLLGSAIVGIVTLVEWFNPTTPAFIMLGAALLPAVLGGLLVMSPPDQHPWTRQLVITGALPGIIFGLVAVAVGLTWTLPQTRASAASKLSSTFQDAVPLLRALNDRDTSVAASACKNLAKSNFEQIYGEAISNISNRPKVAVECFQDSGATANDIVFRLSENWHRALLNHDSDEDEACELSDALGTIAANHPINAVQLLDCAFQSRHLGAQECCTETLNRITPTSQQLVNQLNTEPDMLVAFTLAPQLINASFSGRPRLGSINLETPGFQKAALLTACSSLQQESNKTVAAFYQLAQTLECMPPSETPPTSLVTWTHICKEMTPELISNVNAQPNNVFCDMLAQENKRLAEPLPEPSPEEAEAMARLADGIEYAAHSNEAQDFNSLMEDLGLGKPGVDFNSLTPDNLAALQNIMRENTGKTARSPEYGEPLTPKRIKEIQALLADSKESIPDMVNTLEKRKDLTKEQKESVKALQQNLKDNPDFLTPGF